MTATGIGIAVFLILAVGSVDTKDDYTQVKQGRSAPSTPAQQQPPPVAFPDRIAAGKVKLVGEGYKVECAFKKGEQFCLTSGTLKVEIFNWEMSDNVQYSDPDTYTLGTLLATQSFTISPQDFDTSLTPPRIGLIVKTTARPNKTYISARFTISSSSGAFVTGGSDYQAIQTTSY